MVHLTLAIADFMRILIVAALWAAASAGGLVLLGLVALGHIAHQSAAKALGGKLPKLPFGHGAEHRLPSGILLLDSYHCSRYNQDTGRLTAAMFEAVFERAVALGGG